MQKCFPPSCTTVVFIKHKLRASVTGFYIHVCNASNPLFIIIINLLKYFAYSFDFAELFACAEIRPCHLHRLVKLGSVIDTAESSPPVPFTPRS